MDSYFKERDDSDHPWLFSVPSGGDEADNAAAGTDGSLTDDSDDPPMFDGGDGVVGASGTRGAASPKGLVHRPEFYRIGHCLWILLFGMIGGCLAGVFRARSQVKSDTGANTGHLEN